MDREQWAIVRAAVTAVTRRAGRMKRAAFSDRLILLMYLWMVAHDRSQCWACRRTSYGDLFRPRRLPSRSQFGRRIAAPRSQRLLQAVHEQLAGLSQPTGLSYFDGKPLTVGVASKDRDAKKGHVMGGFAKGYKLHAWMTEDRRIPVWSVTPLNRHELPVALTMMPHLPRLSDRSLVLADQNYEAADLHKAVQAKGGRLLCPPRGFAEHPVTRRQMGAVRRESLAVWQDHEPLADMVYRHRIHVEGGFGNLCGTAGGLTHLPPWVRGLPRVTRWVGGKIILYHARLQATRLARAA